MELVYNHRMCVFLFLSTWSLAGISGAEPDVNPRALAILQHVVDVRTDLSAFSMQYEHRINGEGSRWVKINTSGDKLRVDLFGKKSMDMDSRESTVLVDPPYVWAYHGGENNSLERNGPEFLRRTTLYVVSPRTLGLVTFYSVYDELDGVVYAGADSIKLLGESAERGEPTVKIEVVRGEVMYSYEIAPESGRVYRRVNYYPYKPGESNSPESVMDAMFSDDTGVEWGPTQVATRKERSKRVEVLKDIHYNPNPPPKEVFELYSLGVHKGVTVVDNDQMLQIGTWNGNRIVGLKDEQSGTPDQSDWGYYVLLGLTTAGVLGVFWFIRQRMRRNPV